MQETKLTAAAASLAQRICQGQVGRDGQPAILRLQEIARCMETEEEVCAAYLQDVFLDAQFDLEQLRLLGMSEAVIEAVCVMARGEYEDFTDYAKRVAANELASKVKRVDWEYLCDESHYISFTGTDHKRRTSYLEGIALIDESRNAALKPELPAAPLAPAPPKASDACARE